MAPPRISNRNFRRRRQLAKRSSFLLKSAVVFLPFGTFMYSLYLSHEKGLLSSGYEAAGDLVRYDASRTAGKTIAEAKRRIHTVFSTNCRPYQDWQSHSLAYNHRKMKIAGRLVRLMACDDPNYDLPKNSYERYRVVRTPDFARQNTTDLYWPINRPMGLAYWLRGLSDDVDIPAGDDVVIIVDPDQLFLTDKLDMGNITSGFGTAAKFGLGNAWLTELGLEKFCNGMCDNIQTESARTDYSYGAPYALTASDALRFADLWVVILQDINRSGPKGWMQDMYAAILALKRLEIVIDVRKTMLARTDVINLSWMHVRWDFEPISGQIPGDVWVAHYCQTYKVGNFSWSKHNHKALDIRKCDRSMNMPLPVGLDAVAMENAEGKPFFVRKKAEALTVAGKHGGGKLTMLRKSTGEDGTREMDTEVLNAWMLGKTLIPISEAIEAYYDEFCAQ